MSTEAIHVTINGEDRQMPRGETLLDLLRSLALDPARVAIECDRRIVKQPLWSETEVAEGAKIEIVQFVGGG